MNRDDPVAAPGDGPLVTPAPRAGVGRPRSERAHAAILAAAADLLVEGGWAAATIEAIAARAGVSKVTIYKWWASRGAVAVEAYFARYAQTIVFEDSGDIAADLTNQIRVMIRAFRGRAGQVMAELVGQAQLDPHLAEMLRAQWIQPRREITAGVLRRAIDRGQLRADVDLELLMDQLYGPLYYRLVLAHQPLVPSLAEGLVRAALDGARPR